MPQITNKKEQNRKVTQRLNLIAPVGSRGCSAALGKSAHGMIVPRYKRNGVHSIALRVMSAVWCLYDIRFLCNRWVLFEIRIYAVMRNSPLTLLKKNVNFL